MESTTVQNNAKPFTDVQKTIMSGIMDFGFPAIVREAENLLGISIREPLVFCDLGDNLTYGAVIDCGERGKKIGLSISVLTETYPGKAGMQATFAIGHEIGHLFVGKNSVVKKVLSDWRLEEGLCDVIGAYMVSKIYRGVAPTVKEVADVLDRTEKSETIKKKLTEFSPREKFNYLEGRKEIIRQLREMEHLSFKDALDWLINGLCYGKLTPSKDFINGMLWVYPLEELLRGSEIKTYS